MKKIIYLCVTSTLLSGCVWPYVDGAPVYGVPADIMIAEQPKYKYEEYQSFKVDAVEWNAMSPTDHNATYYQTQAPYKVQTALQKSVVDFKKQNPTVFKNYKSFLVGAFVDADNINKSNKAGRVSAMGMTNAIGKTSHAQNIRYKRNMLDVKNGMIVPTNETTIAANTFNADALVMGAYKKGFQKLIVRYAIYDAKTHQPLGEQVMIIPMDSNALEYLAGP